MAELLVRLGLNTVLLCALLVAALCPSGFARAADRPNVILLMTDDQGYGDLGCHGNPIIKTPNLDKLHAESIRMTDFHVDPFCTPTRAALMTGRYSASTGAHRTSSGRTMLHNDEVTMAEVFRRNGYATGIFGKWHLGDNYPHRPQDRGSRRSPATARTSGSRARRSSSSRAPRPASRSSATSRPTRHTDLTAWTSDTPNPTARR